MMSKRKMRVMLVQPKIHGKPSSPPLGLAYLASSIRDQGGFEVDILDNEIHAYDDEKLGNVIAEYAPDILGFTSLVFSRFAALNSAAVANAPYVVFGGPQPTLEPDFYLTKPNYFVIRGESEVAFTNFCVSLRDQKPMEETLQIKGLSYRNAEGKVIKNPPEPYIKDIDTVPFPAYDLLDMSKYTHSIFGGQCATMMSSRGCPYTCVYCYHVLNTKFRYRSAKNVIDEIKLLRERYGIARIKFFDDVFTLNRKRTVELMNAFIDSKLNFKWQILTRVNLIDKELLKLMYKAGLRHISFGIESGSKKTLSKIDKRVSLDQNIKAIQMCREVGIKTKAYIILGFPWETMEDMEDTIQYLEDVRPDGAQILLATPYQNTDMERMVKEEGYEIDNIEQLESEPDLTVPTFQTKYWTKDELMDKFIEAHYRFFAAGGAGKLKVVDEGQRVLKRMRGQLRRNKLKFGMKRLMEWSTYVNAYRDFLDRVDQVVLFGYKGYGGRKDLAAKGAPLLEPASDYQPH